MEKRQCTPLAMSSHTAMFAAHELPANSTYGLGGTVYCTLLYKYTLVHYFWLTSVGTAGGTPQQRVQALVPWYRAGTCATGTTAQLFSVESRSPLSNSQRVGNWYQSTLGSGITHSPGLQSSWFEWILNQACTSQDPACQSPGISALKRRWTRVQGVKCTTIHENGVHSEVQCQSHWLQPDQWHCSTLFTLKYHC